MELREELDGYRTAATLPEPEALEAILDRANAVLAAEDAETRPRDAGGAPGGLVELDKELPTALLPDIHARPGLVWAALNHELPVSGRLLDAISEGKAQLVCLGDYFHGEGRVKQRWLDAFAEFSRGFAAHEAMDQEMRESLAVLLVIARLKAAFPSRIHLLKGNHENVTNESGNGNHPFGKYAYEGDMVFEYLRLFYGEKLIAALAEFEKRLPLLAIGRHFLVSHAEPERFFSRAELIESRYREEVIYGLTWTDNDRADPHAVGRMLEHYLGEENARTALYFGGHRPVTGLYALRAEGRYVQTHNPARYIMAFLPADRSADPGRDIIDLGAVRDAYDG